MYRLSSGPDLFRDCKVTAFSLDSKYFLNFFHSFVPLCSGRLSTDQAALAGFIYGYRPFVENSQGDCSGQ